MTRGDILFNAEGSIRYHRSRADHFAFRNRWLSIFNIFLGTGIVAATLAKSPVAASAAGILIAFANTYRLVAKPEEASLEHEKLCRDWAELLGEVQGNSTPNPKILGKWIKRAKGLDAECVEDMKAVKAHAYNETMAALGRKGTPYKLNGFQKATKHFLRHTHGFDSQNLAGESAVP